MGTTDIFARMMAPRMAVATCSSQASGPVPCCQKSLADFCPTLRCRHYHRAQITTQKVAHLLGALDTQANVSIRVSHHHKSLHVILVGADSDQGRDQAGRQVIACLT